MQYCSQLCGTKVGDNTLLTFTIILYLRSITWTTIIGSHLHSHRFMLYLCSPLPFNSFLLTDNTVNDVWVTESFKSIKAAGKRLSACWHLSDGYYTSCKWMHIWRIGRQMLMLRFNYDIFRPSSWYASCSLIPSSESFSYRCLCVHLLHAGLCQLIETVSRSTRTERNKSLF